jgi:hypothetical protein
MAAFVRTTIRQDTGDVVSAKNIEHALERIIRIGLLIVVQMRVKDFQRLLRTPRNRYGDGNDRCSGRARDHTRRPHGKPLDPLS